MPSDPTAMQRWRVRIRNLETRIRIGIHAHEREAQRVLVSAMVEGMYPVRPRGIGECFNYDHIHDLVVRRWPEAEHRLLLESCVTELLEHIFAADDRVERAWVSVGKPDIFAHAELVGVEAEWTRDDYRRLLAK